MTTTASTPSPVDILNALNMHPDDQAKFAYAEGVRNLRTIEDTLPPEEFAKIRPAMSDAVSTLYAATIGQRNWDTTYSDGSPIVRLAGWFGDFIAYSDVNEYFETLGELIGEYEPPPGWWIEIAVPPQVSRAKKARRNPTPLERRLMAEGVL